MITDFLKTIIDFLKTFGVIALIIFSVIFIFICIALVFIIRAIKKHSKDVERIEKENAAKSEEFDREIKKSKEAMEEFRRKNFPDD